jgi:hypothetical protein
MLCATSMYMIDNVIGLSQYDSANEACRQLGQFLERELAQDELSEHLLSTDISHLMTMILFSGQSIPPPDSEPDSWSKAWRTLYNTYRIRGVRITRELLASIARGRVGLALRYTGHYHSPLMMMMRVV